MAHLTGCCGECGAVFTDFAGRISGFVGRYDFIEANGMDRQLVEDTRGWDYLLNPCRVCDTRSQFVVVERLSDL